MIKPSGHSSLPPERPLQGTAAWPPPLDIQVSYRFGIPLIYVGGELGHDSANQLRESIDQELAGLPKALLLEFSRLAYIDSGGLSLLFDAARKASDKVWLGIVSPSPNVRKFTEMVGLYERTGFHLIENLEAVPAALAELPD